MHEVLMISTDLGYIRTEQKCRSADNRLEKCIANSHATYDRCIMAA